MMVKQFGIEVLFDDVWTQVGTVYPGRDSAEWAISVWRASFGRPGPEGERAFRVIDLDDAHYNPEWEEKWRDEDERWGIADIPF